jgi:hypothetical protein
MNSEDLYYDGGSAESLGPAVRRSKPQGRLTNHVPIRFTDATISKVRDLAEEDGVSISSWIRLVVDREVARRRPMRPHSRVDTERSIELDLDPSHSTSSLSSPTSDEGSRTAELV